MGHTTKYGNYYTNDEWVAEQKRYDAEAEEAVDWLESAEKLTIEAAGYLNREFPETPISTWKMALDHPERAQFTDSHKEARFEAAIKWLDKETGKI